METPIDLGRELTTGFAGYYIRRKARELIGKAGLTAADRPELEQELALVVFLRVPKFDPGRGPWNVFAVTVIERYATTILKSRLARKRSRRLASLNAVCDGVELSRQIEPRHLAAVTGRPLPVAHELVDLRRDVGDVLASLPAELRCLSYHLQHGSITEAALRLRVSRTTIWKRVQRLQRLLTRAGLGNSCQKVETSQPRLR